LSFLCLSLQDRHIKQTILRHNILYLMVNNS
jgi:hypothetical protein